jgi:GNAT superfamily N-acetyltransferase
VTTTFSITGCTPADHPEIAAIQEGLWAGGADGNQAYLEWKYHANPYLDDRYTVLARDDRGRLVGMVGVFGSCWEAEGQRFVLPCVTDTIVAPEHRNRPVFHEMVDAVLDRLRRDGIPWLLDFGDQGTIPSMLIRGWRMVGPWSQSVLTRQGDVLDRLPWSRVPPTYGVRSGVPIRATLEPDVPAMVRVVRGLPADGRVRVARDAAHFTWRAANPLARYYYLLAGDREPEGYLVAHRSGVDTDDGRTPTTIVECEAGSDDVYADLVLAAHQLLPGRRLIMWTRDMSDAGRAVLAGLGTEVVQPTGRFTRDRPLPNLLVRDTGVDQVPAPLADLVKPDVWDFRGVSGRGWR